MQAMARFPHEGEGEFPEFAAGTPVQLGAPCMSFAHWYACTISGHNTYVPDYFVVSGQLICSYNPTEIQTLVGDELQVLSLSYGWFYARNTRTGKVGWVPADKSK